MPAESSPGLVLRVQRLPSTVLSLLGVRQFDSLFQLATVPDVLEVWLENPVCRGPPRPCPLTRRNILVTLLIDPSHVYVYSF